MKPYCEDQTNRPGCACCNTKSAHKLRNKRASESKSAAKRRGKRAVRQQMDRDLKRDLRSHNF